MALWSDIFCIHQFCIHLYVSTQGDWKNSVLHFSDDLIFFKKRVRNVSYLVFVVLLLPLSFINIISVSIVFIFINIVSIIIVIVIILLLYPFSELARPLCFPANIYLGGTSWTLDPSLEAINCKIKLASNKFILIAV